MNNREKFLKEIAEVINRNSLEAHFNAPRITYWRKSQLKQWRISPKRPHGGTIGTGSKKPDKPGELCGMRIARIARFGGFCPEHKKPEAFDVPKEVRAMAEFFGKMFPGSKVEIHRAEMPKRNPRDKRRAKNQRKNRKGGRNNER